jgi:uncharacterized membrane protein (DUF2068 family)
MMRRPIYSAAVIVHTVNSLFLVLATFPSLLEGPSAQTVTNGVPQIIIVSTSLLGVTGLISSYGAWHGQKWGIMLTIFVEAINGLLAMPGVLVAPSTIMRMASILSVLVALFVIVVMLTGPGTSMQPANYANVPNSEN